MTDDPQARQRQSEARWNATPDTAVVDGAEASVIKLPPFPVSVVVTADDGTELLRVSATKDGVLDVTGPEDRRTEAAARFVAEMRRLAAEVNQ
jgi:hypothetical protein